MKPSFSLIICAYNEAHIIEDCVQKCIKGLSKDFDDFEIILVNDGSKDITGDLMDKLSQKYENVKTLHNLINLNFGTSVQRGMVAATKEIISFNAADLPFLPDKYWEAIEDMGDNDALVIERVQYLGTSGWRRFSSCINRAVMRVLFPILKRGIHDTNFIQVYKNTIVKHVMPLARGPIFTWPEMIFRARYLGLRVKVVQAEYNPVFVRKGAFGKPHDILWGLYEMMRFRLKLWGGKVKHEEHI